MNFLQKHKQNRENWMIKFLSKSVQFHFLWKWTITDIVDIKIRQSQQNDLGKGVMIQLGYIPYVIMYDIQRSSVASDGESHAIE